MPTYISFLKFTQQGAQNIKDSPKRLDAARRAYQAAGAKLKDFYLVMGRYDAVVIADAPDEATVAKLAMAVGALGNVRTETMRAFTEDEYRKIVASLS
jgi:uncharacterized protein with GYD domain